MFPLVFFLELRGFTTVFVQRDEKIIKDNKKKKTKPFCTPVVARLSSSESCNIFLQGATPLKSCVSEGPGRTLRGPKR